MADSALMKAIELVYEFNFGNNIRVTVYSCDGGSTDYNVHAPDQETRKFDTLEEALLHGADLFRESINNNCESAG